MKTKGISFWEQHVEHLVLAGAAVIALALVAMQFIGEPNAVEVAGKSISPGTVDATLRSKADEISGRLDGPAAFDPRERVDGKPVLPRFEKSMTTPVVPEETMFVSNSSVSPGGGDAISPDRPMRVAVVPVPAEVRGEQYWDTILPDVVENTPELKTLLAMEAPYDKTWTTIGAKFDVASLIKQFMEEGPNNEAALPETWHNRQAYFIDVKVRRERYVDSKWVDEKLIDHIPGQVSFRTELKDKVIDDAMRNNVLARSADPPTRSQIIQPPFYGTMAENWSPPDDKPEGEAAPGGAAEDPAAELKDERKRLLDRIELAKKQLKEKGCPEQAPPKEEPPAKTPKPKTPSGGAPSGPGGGAGMGGGAGEGGRGSASPADEAACKRLWAQKEKHEKNLAKVDEELAKLGAEKPDEQVVKEDQEETVIDVWAHDLSVVPGETYRYRVSVEVYNPLFGRKPSLIPEQQPLAEQFTLKSEPSEWTEPITIQPAMRVFVTQARSAGANLVGGLALGSATVEVIRFHNGRPWLQSFPVQPGDRVGEAKAAKDGPSVDYTTDWFVLDVVETLGAEKQDNMSAMVMLQSITEPGKTEWRSPRDDSTNPERKRLINQVRLAEDEEAVASAGSGTPPG